MTRKETIARLEGVFVPALTPFNRRGGIDLPAFRHNLRRFLRGGAKGVVVLGSTGETPYLAEREKLRLLEAARSVISPPQLLLAGTGLEGTHQTIALSRQAIACGADALLLLPPAYYKAYVTPPVVEKHFLTVADALRRPVMLYSIPQCTGITMEPATIGRLSRHENIAGIKESSGRIEYLRAVLRVSSPTFRAMVGSPLIFLDAMRAGASGAILGNANYIPEIYAEMYDLFSRGEVDAADKLQRHLEGTVREINLRLGIPGIKYAAACRGYRGGEPRPPFLPLRPTDRKKVLAALRRARIPFAPRKDV